MKTRRHHTGESILLYYYEKVALCQNLNLSFADANEKILLGLYTREIAANLITVIHNDYDVLLHNSITVRRIKDNKSRDARRDRERFDRFEKCNQLDAAKTYERRTYSINNNGRRWNDERYGTHNNNRMTAAGGDKDYCYRCGKVGHISRQCKHTETVCYVCKKEGHIAPRCPQKNNNTEDN